jgi:hypothetical protein
MPQNLAASSNDLVSGLFSSPAMTAFNPVRAKNLRLILIRRHGLRRELPADPIRFLGHDDAQSISRRRKRRRTTTQSAADDNKIGAEFLQGDMASRRAGRRRAGRAASNRSGAEDQGRRDTEVF